MAVATMTTNAAALLDETQVGRTIMAGTKRSPPFDTRILHALRKGPMSTAALAAALNASPTKIRDHCARLEKEGAIQSVSERGTRRLLFCIDHEKVVTANIYPDCDANEHELRYFYPKVRMWKRR